MRRTITRTWCAALLVLGALALAPSSATSAPATGTTVAGGNGAGSGAHQLHGPSRVAVDSARNVYVVDGANHRVQRWARGATTGLTVAGGKGSGTALDQLSYPYGIVLDPAGNLYIADTANHRVTRWAPGATTGVLVAGGNGPGPAANQLNWAYDVALDPAGNLYVADISNHRVQSWAPGAASGVTVAGGNGEGSGANQLDEPTGVSLDAAGNLYVSDSDNHRVQRWAPSAGSGVTVAGGKGLGATAAQLAYPSDLALDAAGNIYAADSDNHRVQRWPAVRPNPLPAAGFTDVPGGLYYSTAVDWAAWTKVTTGYGGTNRFAPDVDVTRGQMVTFLWRTLDSPGGHPAHGFNDVPPSSFYEHALRWARATSITTGYGGTNSFAPEVAVTRGQMVTFLWRLAGQPAGHPAHGFTDVPPGTFYENALRWARATGVTTGIGGTNSFAPDDAVTRAQMVTFLRRLASTDAAWRVGTTIPSTVLF